ncbi:hypothetical protein OG799_16270 [Micromonospora sp. NBC_00898]|uniref:hypothetical protein n=1 Tax=Micromonospora sp. NBC_00898 TaxID=2975981 RepID=UPI00386DD985|nr:hypothetical protein OG799_16270 [Micromonospora sp. NBC_00898]
MATRANTIPGQATLASWAAQQRKVRPQRFIPLADGLRFAFYGRMSTVDFQDRASSCLWQRDHAEDLVAGHGRIVAEFFDEGVSRRVAWPDRPQASRLLAAVADPARGFDA